MSIEKNNRSRWIGFVLLTFLGCVLILHGRLSFCQSDESFYLALAHRLWSGDRLILDEWHPAQFYSPLLYPFYALYKAAVPSGDGVYLAARILYVTLALLCSLLLCNRMTGSAAWPAAFAASALVLLYSRANIAGPSYYNLCLLSALAAVLCLSAGKKTLWFAGGLFLSCAVLCNPYLAFFAVPLLIAACVIRRSRRRGCCCAAGVFAAALLYIVLLFSYGRPAALIGSLKKVLDDPLHQAGLLESLKAAAWGLKQSVSLFILPQTAIGCLLVLLCRKRGRRSLAVIRSAYLLLSLLFVGWTALKAIDSICFAVSVPFTILMLPAALEALLERKKPFALALYAAGLLLAMAFCLGSNTGLDAMTVGFACSSAGGAPLLFSGKGEGKALLVRRGLVCCLLAVLIGTFGAHRFLGIYRDAPVSELVQRIEHGPAAGLYTTKEHAAEYEEIRSKLLSLRQRFPDAERVLISKRLPWAYLVTDLRCADMSAWTSEICDPRLEEYYADHPRPDLVIILAADTASYKTAPFNNHQGSSQMNANPLEGPFFEYLQKNGDLVDETGLMRVYRLKNAVGGQ
ncbi:MAG: hypothetical protein IJH48_01425 [Oscillospiraceae bacterium]|nr:hypothetical protein [Oscillospiraceae bacterium]